MWLRFVNSLQLQGGWNVGKDIPNLGLVKEGFQLYDAFPNVTFKHIMAHTGKQDRHSIGNENADRLAHKM